MNPINYLQPQTPLFSGLAQGLVAGNAIVAMKKQAEQRQAMIQKAADDEARKQQFVADTDAYFRNPTYENGARLIAAHPQMRETLKAAVGNMEAGQKEEQFGFGLKLENALESNDIKTAQAILDERMIAYKNKGLDTAELDEMYDGLADGEGDDVLASTRIKLFGLDEKKYNEIQKGKRESATAPLELKEQEAKTSKAITEANYIDQEKAASLEKSGWDIAKIKSDIGLNSEAQKIRLMEAQLQKEANGLRAQELQQKIEQKKATYNQKIDERVAAAEGAKSAIDTTRDLVTTLQKHPGFSDLFGLGVSSIPGSDGAGAAALLEELKAQMFTVSLDKMRGLGAMGEKEGAKLEASMSSIKPGMPEKDAIAAFGRINKSLDELDRIREIKFGKGGQANSTQSSSTELSGGFKVIGVK